MFKNILLCTHGSTGGQRAEKLVFERLEGEGAKITVLTVINQDWELMTGDDWLNTSRTQRNFMSHVNAQLSGEIEEAWELVRKTWPKAERATFVKRVGEVEKTMVEVAKEIGADLIVIGPWQKKRKGFKARIESKTLHPILPAPLMIAP